MLPIAPGLRRSLPMQWTHWQPRFNLVLERPFPRTIAIPSFSVDAHSAVGCSLAKMQLAETGEGRIAREVDRVMLPGINDEYRVALKQFIKSEAVHAALLKVCVQSM